MATTIREQIMAHLKSRYESVAAGVNGYNITWNKVLRRSPTKHEAREGNHTVVILDVGEKVKSGVGFDYVTLRVLIEFHVPIFENDEPSTVLNEALGDVVRLAMSDIQCGGLTLNVEDDGNELDIDGAEDKVGSGVVALNVQYRRRSNDPTRKA